MSKYFSKFPSDKSEIAISIAIGVGIVTAAGALYWYKKKYSESLPKNWRRVGELSDLICYPIKSCASIRVKSISCSKIGLQDGFLRDRIFTIITTEGEFVTARQYSKIVLVQPEIDENIMRLSAPGMIEVELNINKLFDKKPVKCTVWNQKIDAIDCGEEVARWFSRYVLSEDFGLRLVFYPKSWPTRDVREKYKKIDTMTPSVTGAFHDATSYMLFNESSLSDLNLKLNNPADVLNFRPNFVVKGPMPYEEDNWKWVKIGDVIFRNVKPCTRCTFTNINPTTGICSPDENPLKTLKQYRLFENFGSSPCLGIHLDVHVDGNLSIGDTVYVEAEN